jgi:hypothetical protein
LLEESTSQRELDLKKEIDQLKRQYLEMKQPEIKLSISSTNLSLFNIGKTTNTNNHEIKIDTSGVGFLSKAAEDLKSKYTP